MTFNNPFVTFKFMEVGTIVEYIDQQKILCAMVLEVKKQRLLILTETNKEVNLALSRLSHKSNIFLNITLSRDEQVNALKDKSLLRQNLMQKIDVKELWELLSEEPDWIDIKTMSEFCFTNPTEDHDAAIIRAFFGNRIYFKFNRDSFLPNKKEIIENIIAQVEAENRKKEMIEKGSNWLIKAINDPEPVLNDDMKEVIEILKSYYIFEKKSKHSGIAKAILSRAGVDLGNNIFNLFVRLGIWKKDENLDLEKYSISSKFNHHLVALADNLKTDAKSFVNEANREDLTSLPLLTIDGKLTLDFDDALSIKKDNDHFMLGVHIADVAHFVKKGDRIDQEALNRASSIYMPDDKIPMLPPLLSEDLCSLKIGEVRPCISVLVRLNKFFEIKNYRVVASYVNIKRQLSYSEVDNMTEDDEEINVLFKISEALRKKRIDSGALEIILPEINVWFDKNNEISVSRTVRESPGRSLVSEIMIMANWLMGKFIVENEIHAIFRSQPEPKLRLYKGIDESLFLNYMQRRHLNRAIISYDHGYHSGLGLDVYLTATSPLRKYFDLVTQRQIRSIIGLESSYTKDEISNILHYIEQPISIVAHLQYIRKRYWLLKYLEKQKRARKKALVFEKRKDQYSIILIDYMIECKLSASGIELKPRDIIEVLIQYADARRDLLSVFIG